ncbi:MAG TPA: transposase [Kofleriaceae bacterium]|jgi:transposase
MAKAKGIRVLPGDKFLVPSQTNGSGGYIVDATAKTCSCPDHEDRAAYCKHLWCVAYFRAEIEMPDGTTVVIAEKRVTYRQAWSSYNAAQKHEKAHAMLLLRGLCDGIVQPPYKGNGRPPLTLADVVYASTMRVYGGMSGRRSDTDLRTCADDGLVTKAPGCSTIFRYLDDARLAPLLKALVHEAASPLRAIETQFATDSTGIATSTYARWYDEKYGGEKKQQRWLKLHAQVGTITNAIVSVEVTGNDVGDSPMLAPLLASSVERGFNVEELSADKAYLSNENLVAIEAANAIPYIPFKSNSRPTGKTEAWRRLWHTCEARNDEFLAHYHRRSNVESTFSALKRKFGASVRAKTADAQVNEALLKCLCFNLSCVVHAIYECGIEPTFWQRFEAA